MLLLDVSVFLGTMHYVHRVYLFFSSATSACFHGSKQRNFSNKNYLLQKLIHVILHNFLLLKVILFSDCFYHHCLRMTTEQNRHQQSYDWLNSRFYVAVFVLRIRYTSPGMLRASVNIKF